MGAAGLGRIGGIWLLLPALAGLQQTVMHARGDIYEAQDHHKLGEHQGSQNSKNHSQSGIFEQILTDDKIESDHPEYDQIKVTDGPAALEQTLYRFVLGGACKGPESDQEQGNSGKARPFGRIQERDRSCFGDLEAQALENQETQYINNIALDHTENNGGDDDQLFDVTAFQHRRVGLGIRAGL